MRHGSIEEVEALLKARRQVPADAVGLNLLGVLAELRGDAGRARELYGRAIRADRHFVPAQQNMQRWFELNTLGRTVRAVAIGEALTDLWLARLTQAGRAGGRIDDRQTCDARYASLRDARAARHEPSTP